jgi:hypothetical protein
MAQADGVMLMDYMWLYTHAHTQFQFHTSLSRIKQCDYITKFNVPLCIHKTFSAHDFRAMVNVRDVYEKKYGDSNLCGVKIYIKNLHQNIIITKSERGENRNGRENMEQQLKRNAEEQIFVTSGEVKCSIFKLGVK